MTWPDWYALAAVGVIVTCYVGGRISAVLQEMRARRWDHDR